MPLLLYCVSFRFYIWKICVAYVQFFSYWYLPYIIHGHLSIIADLIIMQFIGLYLNCSLYRANSIGVSTNFKLINQFSFQSMNWFNLDNFQYCSASRRNMNSQLCWSNSLALDRLSGYDDLSKAKRNKLKCWKQIKWWRFF